MKNLIVKKEATKRRVMVQKRSHVIIIPADIVEEQNLQKGDDMAFTTKGTKIIMEKV